MRRSKRKIGSKYASPTLCDEPQSKRDVTKIVLNQQSKISTIGNLIERLFEVCFLRMVPHVWMRLVPTSSNDVENFAYCIGQKWEIIRAMLLKLGYLYKYGESIRINMTKLHELEGKNIHGSIFRVGTSQNYGSSKVHYIKFSTTGS